LAELWQNHTGILSTQILQEFFVNVTRKLKPPLTLSAAREIIRLYSTWVLYDTSPEQVLRATEIMDFAGFSFWDSLVIASAEKSGAAVLYSEDLQHGQRIAGLVIKNPFV
jgi:predicted nucleic acid-binding protein